MKSAIPIAIGIEFCFGNKKKPKQKTFVMCEDLPAGRQAETKRFPCLHTTHSLGIMPHYKKLMKTKRTIYTTTIFLLLAILVFGQTKDTEIKKFLDNLKISDFSGAILVANNNKIIEKRAYGLASIEYGIQNKVDTKFNIASITKMITAVATLQLYENGKVGLKNPIGEYLPDYPNKMVRDSVTIHQLLTHTSGNNNFYEGEFLQTHKLKYKNISDFVPHVR